MEQHHEDGDVAQPLTVQRGRSVTAAVPRPTGTTALIAAPLSGSARTRASRPRISTRSPHPAQPGALVHGRRVEAVAVVADRRDLRRAPPSSTTSTTIAGGFRRAWRRWRAPPRRSGRSPSPARSRSEPGDAPPRRARSGHDFQFRPFPPGRRAIRSRRRCRAGREPSASGRRSTRAGSRPAVRGRRSRAGPAPGRDTDRAFHRRQGHPQLSQPPQGLVVELARPSRPLGLGGREAAASTGGRLSATRFGTSGFSTRSGRSRADRFQPCGSSSLRPATTRTSRKRRYRQPRILRQYL